jgi:hypothetical protein
VGQGECRRSRRFDGAKQTRLCFCALLTEGEARVRFYRGASAGTRTTWRRKSDVLWTRGGDNCSPTRSLSSRLLSAWTSHRAKRSERSRKPDSALSRLMGVRGSDHVG